MPLQKSQPQTSSAVDAQISKRQLQERRRTLQTISELSTIDATSVRFLLPTSKDPALVASQTGREKRRSLPQYYNTANFIGSQQAHPPHMRTSSTQMSSATSSLRYEAGWNARRERARMQTEQALANARLQQKSSSQKLNSGNSTRLSLESSAAHGSSNQQHLKLRASQQHLLRGSPSTTTLSSMSERRSSFGSTSKYKDYYSYHESSGRASTDSSSLHSKRGHTPRRSRSSSSSGSTPTHHPPPLPAGLIVPNNQYFISAQQNGMQMMHHESCFGMQQAAQDRAWSLPVMNLDYSIPHYHEVPIQHYRQVTKTSQNRSRPDRGRCHHIQNAAPSQHHNSVSSVANYEKHSRSSRPSAHSRRSHSGSSMKIPSPPLQPPPPAYTAKASNTVLNDQNPDKVGPQPGPAVQHEKRIVPNRENLTKWKTEREEAKAEFDGMHRAKMKERVRRANELEFQKEKELRALGKGMANEKACRVLGKDVDEEMGFEKKAEVKKKGRGCFGGWFGRSK